jgi:hypothetical protein
MPFFHDGFTLDPEQLAAGAEWNAEAKRRNWTCPKDYFKRFRRSQRFGRWTYDTDEDEDDGMIHDKQVGPFDPADLDADGTFNVDKWVARLRALRGDESEPETGEFRLH